MPAPPHHVQLLLASLPDLNVQLLLDILPDLIVGQGLIQPSSILPLELPIDLVRHHQQSLRKLLHSSDAPHLSS